MRQEDWPSLVLVPCVLMIRADLLPQEDALWLVAFPLLASAYGFCQKAAKTSDHFFLGFPSYWNIVAFYFYVLKTPLWINAFLVLIFSALVFVPFRYLYPSRTTTLRTLTVTIGVVWGVAVLAIIYRARAPSSQRFGWQGARAVDGRLSRHPLHSPLRRDYP